VTAGVGSPQPGHTSMRCGAGMDALPVGPASVAVTGHSNPGNSAPHATHVTRASSCSAGGGNRCSAIPRRYRDRPDRVIRVTVT
jgi:hypothetical protein